MKKNICFLLLLIPALISCGGGGDGGNGNSGYDGREYDISTNQDGSLKAISTKDGNYYNLTISGEGSAIDYERKEAVPWNPIIKKIKSVTIEEGISNIGDYYFSSLPLDYFLLPSTVTSIKENSFNPTSKIYTKGSTLQDNENEIYYYSESKPSENGEYFYLLDGVPYVWDITSVMFIGNSFTYYPQSVTSPTVPMYFESIAESLNQDIEIDYVVKGSHTLTKFANPSDEYGKIVDEKLNNNQYDYVILQEQSTTPINNYNTFLSAVKKLKEKINSTQKDCEVILYETWGSPKAIEDGSFKTVGEMEEKLRKAYKDAGEETECKVHYIGQAFTYVYENEKDINIYYEDNRHQNEYGAYLSAACHVRSMFNIDVTKSTEYCGLDEAKCKTLLEVAKNIG